MLLQTYPPSSFRPSSVCATSLKIYYTSPGPTRLCHVTRLQCVVRAKRRACVFFFRAAAFFFMRLRCAVNAPAARGVAAPMQRQLTRARRHTSMQHLYRYQKYQALVMARTHVHFPGLDPTWSTYILIFDNIRQQRFVESNPKWKNGCFGHLTKIGSLY